MPGTNHRGGSIMTASAAVVPSPIIAVGVLALILLIRPHDAFIPLPVSRRAATTPFVLHRGRGGGNAAFVPPSIRLPTTPLLSRVDYNPDGDDSNENEEVDSTEEGDDASDAVDFYDFLAAKAAAVNTEPSKSPTTAAAAGKSRRDRVRKFLTDRMGSSGSEGEGVMVQPIRIDGGSMDADMPGLVDILGGGPSEGAGGGRDVQSVGSGDDSSTSTSGLETSDDDLTDHPDDVAAIDLAFTKFKSETRAQLAEQRASDPDLVPPNAEAFLDRVIEEVREYDLKELREERARNELRDYERSKMDKLEEDLKARGGTDDPIVKEILKEAKEDEETKFAESEGLKSFKDYEKSMRDRVEEADLTKSAAASDIGDDDDIDVRALRIMEELLAKRSEEPTTDGGEDEEEDMPEWDTDNLEDGIAEMKAAIEAKAKGKDGDGGGIPKKPQTMKEWQMYRSIATRIAEEDGINEVDNETVASQLESWKEFQKKEEDMRRDAGLTKGARMPFPWVDFEEDEEEAGTTAKKKKANKEDPVDKRHPDEIRADYDRKALQVLDDLASKTADPARQQKLRNEIEELKADLIALEKKIEERGPYVPEIEEAVEEEDLAGPLDVSDIFGQSTDLKGDAASPPRYLPDSVVETYDAGPPPDSAFFADSFEEDAAVDEESSLPPPPETPFFSSGDDGTASDAAADMVEGDDEEDEDVKSLGSMEEQQFRSMTRRAGVSRSQAGEEELKKQWEEYLEAEKAMRDQTGLSGGEVAASIRSSKVDYDIEEVVQEGGDIDADKILASIGERPGKKRKTDDGGAGTVEKREESLGAKSEDDDEGYQQFIKYEQERMEEKKRLAQENAGVADATAASPVAADEEKDGEGEDVIVYHKHATQWDKTSVTDQLYRSLSPEGSLKNDPEAKEKDKAAFEEYLKKEQEMRKAVEDMDVRGVDVMGKVSFANEEGTDTETEEQFLDLDKVEDYVDDALDSIGPRPEVRKRKRADPDYARDYSDRRLLETTEDEDDEDDEDLPSWVKQERQEESERRKDPGYDDTDAGDSSLRGLDYEEKQRQAEEFEEKYLSENPEISIGDVLGRDYFGPDDEPDDFAFGASSFSSFDKRKNTLLEYTELSVAELNSLIAYKEAEGDAGASRYMKKVRKPYKEFGAIFRLEGLLVNIAGLQLEVWKKVAEAHHFEPPSLEDVKLAAAHRAAYAVQRIFYWTDDVVEVRAVAKTHHDALEEAFGKWMEEEGVTYTPPEGPKSFDLFGVGESSESATPEATTESVDQDEVEPEQGAASEGSTANVPQPTESEYIGMQFNAWKMAAEKFGFSVPTIDEMQVATYLAPEEAVTRAFKWNPARAEEAVSTYFDALRNFTNKWAEQHGADTIAALKRPTEPSETSDAQANDVPEGMSADALSKDDLMEMQLFAWTTAAEKHGFESPSLEEVQLASWVSASEAIERVYNWADDPASVENIASTYRGAMKKISYIYIKKKDLQMSSASKDAGAAEESTPAAPTPDDIMRLQLNAWTETAEKHDCNPPNIDEVQLATFGSAEEAIIRVFKWTDDEEKSQEIAATHRAVLAGLSKAFMQQFSQGAGSGGTSFDLTRSVDAAEQEEELPFFELREGAVEWIKSLLDVEMPCAVVSHLEREQLDVILEQTGLAKFFPPDRRVSSTNFYGSQSQEMLGAALRLERRPDMCAVFDTTPSSSLAAHEVDMQSVGMIAAYKNYDLLSADLTVKYFDQLHTQILRGLFSDTRLDEPQTEIQSVQPNAAPKVQTQVRHWEEGDRE